MESEMQAIGAPRALLTHVTCQAGTQSGLAPALFKIPKNFILFPKARAEAFEQFPTQVLFEYQLKVCRLLF